MTYEYMRRHIPTTLLSTTMAILVAAGTGTTCQADSLAPPPYEFMDNHGVNMASGNVSPSLNDVRIGDDNLGLSHSISTFSSSFVNYDGTGPLGFRDKFYGFAMKEIHHKPSNCGNNPSCWVYVVRVFDVGGSFDFAYTPAGVYTAYNGDPRSTLLFVSGVGLIWTKPDGTVVTFGAQSFDPVAAYPGTGIPIKSIVYPNGFTINIWGWDPPGGATTNTGYQLRYIYVQNTAPVDNDDPTNTEIPPAMSVNWSHTMPKYVVAINNAVDYCVPNNVDFQTSVASACPNLTRTWPTVTYGWPNGMPRAMYLHDASFTVTDAMNRVTEYQHHPYTKPAVLNDPMFRVPRLVGIKTWGSTAPSFTYDYTTRTTSTEVWQAPVYTASIIAAVSSSTLGSDQNGYSIAYPYQYAGEFVNGGGGARGINRVLTEADDFGIWEMDSWDKTVELERNSKNRVASVYDKLNAIMTVPGYDARYNVNSITKNGVVVQTAQYPTACANSKTCNQATWVRDAKGNQTDYEYDSLSGAVSRIRLPADNNGIRAEKRFTYTPKYAYFLTAPGTYQAASTPVYLLTRERTCMLTATLADGSGCSGGATDEVVTDYDYGPAGQPNNLLLRGESVTAYAGGQLQVHRNCYSYDSLGNRIGETTPNAALLSCY